MSAISSSVKQSLLTLFELHHISEAELCRRTNIPQSTLSRLLTGSTDDPRASTLSSIAKYFNISVDQLIGLKPIANSINEAATETTTLIPLLSLSDSEIWAALHDTMQQEEHRQWTETESFNKNCFSLKVLDESMWPQFIEGTMLIVNPALQPKNRDFVVCYLIKEQQAMFRQYIDENNNKILKPLNQMFSSIKIGKNDRIVGVVVQARNDFNMS